MTTTRRRRDDDVTTTRQRRPPPHTHDTTTYGTTKLESFALCSQFIDSKSLSCNPWYLFMVTFPNKELDIASFPSPLRLLNKILSHTQGDLISLICAFSTRYHISPPTATSFRAEDFSGLFAYPPAFPGKLADPQTLHDLYAVTSHTTPRVQGRTREG